MSQLSKEEYVKKKIDFADIRTQAKISRLYSCHLRIKAILIHAELQDTASKNLDLRARAKEWYLTAPTFDTPQP